MERFVQDTRDNVSNRYTDMIMMKIRNYKMYNIEIK